MYPKELSLLRIPYRLQCVSAYTHPVAMSIPDSKWDEKKIGISDLPLLEDVLSYPHRENNQSLFRVFERVQNL